MRTNDKPTDLFAGTDNLSLDKRKFEPSQEEIERVCNFFSIGKLKYFEKEKDIIVSHSNFFIFVATTHGQFALKFYPTDAVKTIAIEYAINRFLISHYFPTPIMYTGQGAKPSYVSNDRLATCFSYINGAQVWQQIKKRNTIYQINAIIVSLKNILLLTKGRIPFLKHESFTKTITTLVQTSQTISDYDQKMLIETSLQNACQTYKSYQKLFTRQWLHNNTTLTNFLIDKNTVYTLDLSHIREDYILSDLASLIISCLFLNIPSATIKTIIKDYFYQHKMADNFLPVLNTLITVGLIKEYLKNIQRERTIEISTYPQDIVRQYICQLSKHKKTIIAALKKKTIP